MHTLLLPELAMRWCQVSDYTKSPVYKVLSWLIDELYSNDILRESNYTDAPPIIPIQQVPESNDNQTFADIGLPEDAPFIVYDIVVSGNYGTDFWNRSEEVSLWAYDYDIEKLFEIKEFLIDLLGRYDLSATDINDFDDGESVFRFHFFDIMTGLPTDEIDQIVGRYGINLVITYEYSREIQSSGRFA